MRSSLIKDDLHILWVVLLELLLQEAAAMLILAQTVDLLTRHSLQVVVHKAISICVFQVSNEAIGPWQNHIPFCIRRL